MTPKEKAKELYSKMYRETPVRAIIAQIEEDKECAKQCALRAVDEIINEYQSMSDLETVLIINNEITFVIDKLQFYQEVKNEIDKL